MKKITKKKWINALRSGKYEQGTGRLKMFGKYCCLGVLCEITGNSKNRNMMSCYPKENLCGETIPFCGISEKTIKKLAYLNDKMLLNFNEIANYISKNLKTED